MDIYCWREAVAWCVLIATCVVQAPLTCLFCGLCSAVDRLVDPHSSTSPNPRSEPTRIVFIFALLIAVFCQELHADIARQDRVRINAALIEARDRQASLRVDEAQVQGALLEPAQTQTAGSQPIETNTNQNGSKLASASGGLEPVRSRIGVGSPSSAQQPHATPSHAADEPQPWTPRAIRRAAN